MRDKFETRVLVRQLNPEKFGEMPDCRYRAQYRTRFFFGLLWSGWRDFQYAGYSGATREPAVYPSRQYAEQVVADFRYKQDIRGDSLEWRVVK